ncbi:toll-like receptor 3 [Colias croceus]|uniref:toll-like receptor 3 n=1 Tax=Colias crocea TaxID=72248 RepID=UPI001E27D63A|nr:toll-like receptor 3 [Colias croceus]
MSRRKIINLLISKTLLFCLIAKSSSLEECIQDFNTDLCMIEAKCRDVVTLESVNDGLVGNCYDSYRYRQWDRFPMKIAYEDTSNEDSERKPLIQDYYYRTIIIILDLSHNNYTIFPLLQDMQNMEILNLSFNLIESAELSSEYSFPNLQELDLSHNLLHELTINYYENSFTNLVKLNISHNNFVQLDPATFHQYNNLQYIDLSYNDISKLDEFT